MNKNSSKIVLLKGRKCAICGKVSMKPYHSFCSKRCADIDLGHWLNEHYGVPVLSTEPNDDEYSDQ